MKIRGEVSNISSNLKAKAP